MRKSRRRFVGLISHKLFDAPESFMAGLEAMGLWVLALSWCCAYDTNGVVVTGFAKSFAREKYKRLAAKLVSAGFWTVHERGWQFVAYESLVRPAASDEWRQPIPKALRLLVIERDGFVCQICLGDVDPTDVHIDHNMPVALGGPTSLDNLRVSHSVCNMRKGSSWTPAELS